MEPDNINGCQLARMKVGNGELAFLLGSSSQSSRPGIWTSNWDISEVDGHLSIPGDRHQPVLTFTHVFSNLKLNPLRANVRCGVLDDCEQI